MKAIIRRLIPEGMPNPNLGKPYKNMNEKLKDYRVYSPKGKTNNIEVIKNIEDISNSILNKNKVKFEYWKYCIEGDKVEKKIVSTPLVSPYAIIYDKQQFYKKIRTYSNEIRY